MSAIAHLGLGTVIALAGAIVAFGFQHDRIAAACARASTALGIATSYLWLVGATVGVSP